VLFIGTVSHVSSSLVFSQLRVYNEQVIENIFFYNLKTILHTHTYTEFSVTRACKMSVLFLTRYEKISKEKVIYFKGTYVI